MDLKELPLLKALARVREMLDSRYDHITNGKVKLLPGDEALAQLHARIDARSGDF
ncbi:MAG: hypothetical protein OHK0021_08830 [Bryobacter sp.]